MTTSISEHSPFIWGFLVFSLGLRHGFDLDHIATIDAIARTVKEKKRLAKTVGVLFSLGHGLVVMVLALVIANGALHSGIPKNLDVIGHWISIFFLLLFGLLTCWTIFSKPNQNGLPLAWRGLLYTKLLGKCYQPLTIILIGALFALSFDTFTQVAFFSLSASLVAGSFFSLMLGCIFMFGMMLADGLNGVIISSLILRADKTSQMIAKGIGLLIASFSLVLATLGIIDQLA